MGGGVRETRSRVDWVPILVCAFYTIALFASLLVPGFPGGPVVPGGLTLVSGASIAIAAVAGVVGVAIRRAHPIVVAVGTTGLYAVSTAFGVGAFLVLPAIITLYSLGRLAPVRTAAVVGAACSATTAIGAAAGVTEKKATEALVSLTTFALVCCFGMVLRARDKAHDTMRRSREAAQWAAVMERERNLAVAQSRIAAELHDSIGHGLTTIIALSEGLTGATGDPMVDEALAGINTAARECLEQTRRAVRALGPGEQTPADPGEHTWDDIHSIIANARRTGISVTFHETGHRSSDARQASLAFVVAREGITNALRHAREVSMITVRGTIGTPAGWRFLSVTMVEAGPRARPLWRPTVACRWFDPGSWRRVVPAGQGASRRLGAIRSYPAIIGDRGGARRGRTERTLGDGGRAMTRVMVVDDQRLTRLGIALMLRRDPDTELVAEARDGREALEKLDSLSLRRQLMPDVVLMDVRMPRLDGIDATRLVTARYPQIRVLVLTTYDQDDYAFAALAAGAAGFLLKDATVRQLCDAVHAVARGDAVLTPRITGELIRRAAASPIFGGVGGTGSSAVCETLTPRERQVAALVAEGMSNAEIAEKLVIEVASVRRYVSRILTKTGLRDRVQIAVAWHRADMLPGRS